MIDLLSEIEECVLGAMLLESDNCHKVIEQLSPDHFSDDKCKNVFKAISSLSKCGTDIDMITVTKELNKMNVLESIGGGYYVSSLTNRIASSANIESHVLIIKQEYVKRTLHGIFSNAIYKLNEPGTDAFDVNFEVAAKIDSVLNGVVRKSEKQFGEIAKELIEECRSVLESGKRSGIATGIERLNQQTNGWQKGDLIIIAGRPGMGKTSAAMDFALTPAKNGIPVAVFSLEMGEKDLAGRILSMTSSINVQEIITKNLDHSKIDFIERDAIQLRDIPLYIDQTPSISLAELTNKARRLKRTKNIELIIIDYLQLMTGNNSSREQEISTISRGLKSLAKELQVPIIALSQLSRKSEERSDRKPLLSDLRESGAIEQDADIVVFCHRPEYYGFNTYQLGNNEIPSDGLFMFIIAKFRNGRTGEVRARFISENTMVTNYNV